MTVSFHKYGEYFPGTGELRDIGVSNGKYYAVNFPLRDGIDDKSYKHIFEPTIGWVMEYYKPSAVVLQCGGDSLSGDRLGCFNLSMKGHANCVNFVKSFNLPTLILGGGGYTMRNVARTWAYETGQLVGMDMSNDLPFTDYYEYYSPDFELDVRPSNMDNANSTEYLEKIKTQVLENLQRTTQAAPSVQMQDVPREPLGMDETLDEEEDRLDDEEADKEDNKDRRYTQRLWDKQTTRDDELSESDDEDIAEANGIRKQPSGQPRRRGIMDYTNPHAPADVSGENTPIHDDARSLNGIDDDEAGDQDLDGMQMDGAADPPEALTNVEGTNAQLAEDFVAVKAASRSPVPPHLATTKVEDAEVGGVSDAAEPTRSPAPADNEGDDMDLDPEDPARQSLGDRPLPPAPTAPAQPDALPQQDTAQISTPPKSPLAPPTAVDFSAEPSASSQQPPPATEQAGMTGQLPPASSAGADVVMSELVAREREEGVMERNADDAGGELQAEKEGEGGGKGEG